MKTKKILILSSRFPYPLEKGDKLRLYHQMKEISKHYQIELVAITSEMPSSHDFSELNKICDEIHVFRLGLMARVWSMFTGLFKQRPFQVSYFYSKGIQHKIDRLIEDRPPDFIYCQLVRAAEYVKDQPIIKGIDFMDAFSWGMNKRSHSAGPIDSIMYRWESNLLNKYEQHIFEKFDHHTIISEQDRGRMDIKNKGLIKIVPNGVDTRFFIGDDKVEKKYQVCFIGNMGYVPNIKAVTYIAQEIMPSMVAEHEDFKLLVAGARPVPAVRKLANKHIEIRGWVEDIRDAYNEALIFIAPIFIGIGQQNKILEAMSMGIPCITTDVVNNSIGAVEGESILLANNAKEYISTINYLMDNPDKYEILKENAKKFVQGKYSWESQSQELFDIFTES